MSNKQHSFNIELKPDIARTMNKQQHKAIGRWLREVRNAIEQQVDIDQMLSDMLLYGQTPVRYK